MTALVLKMKPLIDVAVAFLSVLAFSILFQVPPKHRFFTGLTGAVGWSVYAALSGFGVHSASASFAAAFVLTLLARCFAVFRREPITTFLICGIFPIVPGAGIYYTGYHLFMGDNAAGLSKGFETIKIAIAIALGIGIALSLPPFLFKCFQRKTMS